MRIASNQYQAAMSAALQKGNTRLSELMQQMSSGERLLVASDDPIASIRLLRLEREEAALAQYRDNIGALRSRLSMNESYLDGMSRDVLAARDLLVWAADGGNTADDLRAMSSSLAHLRDSLFYSANSRDQEGRYLFSGTASNAAALLYDAGAPAGARYDFGGNTERQPVVVGHGVTQPSNVTLEDLPAFLNQLDAVVATLGDAALDPSDPAVGQTVRDALTAADVALARLSGRIAELGGAQNTLSMLANNHEHVSLANQQSLIDFGKLDYAEASIELNGYLQALQASQKAYGRVSALTLFDVI
ncbi:flagellar hook-associated protein 3 FlgL [Crenobacter luteus]|uniref:Flagellar biosynthesis protein FlgL n=1 Tax=Crenobacter luteus TaxID=1452487 RepID=A0A161S9J3_9NEIS|nr:flagellar hook-associated protein FlgL [Crenobacter luteus]KZE31763.1 flagellar biosynthesis protein FlgL [Crenobacter luteus]TCP15627.1 flagellar hook-associated protein 3 FlgL [Crenobacter luteus]